MSALARPAVLASLLAATAVALHPALGSASWLPARELVLAALLLACAAGLAARALTARGDLRVPAWAVAAGVLLSVAALGLDGLRGRHGTLRLGVGQARSHFDELGPGGRELGLRPLRFTIGVERLTAAGGVALAVPGRAGGLEVGAGHAAAFGGFRFAAPRVTPTGGAARLRVSVSDGSSSQVADVAPGVPGRAGDVVVALEEYFPDFALDEKQQPFTRSLEPRNPAALLTVERGGQAHRAFVIQSMPGVHRVEPLGLSFSLLDVVPEQEVELALHREPFAPGVLLGGVVLALGIALGAARSVRASAALPAAGAAAVYGAALLLADGGRLVSWSFGVPSAAGRVALPGVGVLLAISLLFAAAGALWLAALAAAGEGASQAGGRAALWLAVWVGAAGLLLAAVRVAVLPETTLAMVLPVAGLALALALLAVSLRGSFAWLLPAAVVSCALAAVVAGLLGLGAAGTYAVAPAVAPAATALLGLAALEATGLVTLRRVAFLLALVALLVRPA